VLASGIIRSSRSLSVKNPRLDDSLELATNRRHVRGQTCVQSTTACRIDMQPEALEAIGPAAIAFIHGNVEAGLFQSVGEAETSDAAADNQNLGVLFHHR
jgi:hypothetical protein